MSATSPLLALRAGAVGIIELARPEKFNCLSTSVFEAMATALDEFEREGSGVRVLLLRALGKHFCTGADLEEVKAMGSDPEQLKLYVDNGHRVLRRLETSALPVVAACQGLTLAGGSELMLACDVVFAASDARFGDQHAQYGLLPGWGGSQRLARIVGLRRALDLLFSARWIDAPTALAWGLVNHVVESDKLVEAALEYCTLLATRSRTGIATMKHLARAGLDVTLEEGLRMEQAAVAPALAGPDPAEGIAAFEQRRVPKFQA